jgi:ferredoxin
MKVNVDHDVCTGHGRCYVLAPDVFEPDEQGHSMAKYDEVPANLEQQALIGQANCPEGAISCS